MSLLRLSPSTTHLTRTLRTSRTVKKTRFSSTVSLSETEQSYYEKRSTFPFGNTPLFNKLDQMEKQKMFPEDRDMINAICDFSKEEHIILGKVEVIEEDVFKRISEQYYQDKEAGNADSFTLENLISLFYYCLKHNLSEQAMVFYYQLKDLPGLPQTEEIIGVFTMMALQEGKNEEPNELVLTDVYKTIKRNNWYTLNIVDITVFMKAFAKIGKISSCYELWENLYDIYHIPEPQHLLAMLLASSLGGDPKLMARFYQRMARKGLRPENFLLKSLIKNWASYRDNQWLNTKDSNISVDDFCWVVDYALRVHNYKIAYQMVGEIANYTQPASAQLYEIFLSAICRDLPRYRNEARQQIKALRRITNVTSKVRIDNFNDLIQRILDEFGDAAYDLPQQPRPTKPQNLSLTRKQISTRYKSTGERKPRYEVEGASFENLFLLEPKYLARISEWEKEQESHQKKAKIFESIDETIAENLKREAKD